MFIQNNVRTHKGNDRWYHSYQLKSCSLSHISGRGAQNQPAPTSNFCYSINWKLSCQLINIFKGYKHTVASRKVATLLVHLPSEPINNICALKLTNLQVHFVEHKTRKLFSELYENRIFLEMVKCYYDVENIIVETCYFPACTCISVPGSGQFLCLNKSNTTSVVVIRSRTAASEMSLK